MIPVKFTQNISKDKQFEIIKDYLETKWHHFLDNSIHGDIIEHNLDIELPKNQKEFVLSGLNKGHVLYFKIPLTESTLELFINVEKGNLSESYISKFTYKYEVSYLDFELKFNPYDRKLFSGDNADIVEQLNENRNFNKFLKDYFTKTTNLGGYKLNKQPEILFANSRERSFVLISNLPTNHGSNITLNEHNTIELINYFIDILS